MASRCNATYTTVLHLIRRCLNFQIPIKPNIHLSHYYGETKLRPSSETSSNLSVSILPHMGEEVKDQLFENGEEQNTISEINKDVALMPLMALSHISQLCKSVKASVEFYVKVLGFVVIERPPSLDFNGAWLFNYGVGVHLVQKPEDVPLPDADPNRLDPMDNHISFQCEDTWAMEKRLKEMKIKYLKRTINEEEGSPIDQMFFKDPA